jgi:ubiquinone biosynthesis protein
MLRMCALTVFGETDSCPAISGRDKLVGRYRSTRSSPGLSSSAGGAAVVDRDLDIDLRAAGSLEQRAAWARDLGAVELAQGFAAALREELDFRVEARNLTMITASSALHRSSDRIRLPQLYGEFTTQRILVMELLDGVPLGRADAIIAERGLDRIELARTLLRCLLRQIMVDGVFHADPHPGNILVLADG